MAEAASDGALLSLVRTLFFNVNENKKHLEDFKQRSDVIYLNI